MVKPEMGDKGGSSTDEEVRDDVMIRNIEVRGEEVKVKVIVKVKMSPIDSIMFARASVSTNLICQVIMKTTTPKKLFQSQQQIIMHQF